MLEGFWIRNFKSLKQVGIGACFPQFAYIDDETKVFPYALDSATLLAGAAGYGKSTAIDAFTFVSDALRRGVDFACLKRGGFEALYSQDGRGPMSFGFLYREPGERDPVTYALSLRCAKNKTPYIESELLAYRRGKESVPIFFLQNGVKSIRYLAPDARIGTQELTQIEFTDFRHLGLAALKSHPKFPVLASVRRLFEEWALCNFTGDPARGLDFSLPRRHDSPRGVSLSGVVRHAAVSYGTEFESLLNRVAAKLPGVEAIHADLAEPDKPRLAFKMERLERPVPMTLLSDATIRLFTYMILLEEERPAPLVVLEEPENGLDRHHTWKLAELIHGASVFATENRQLFATTQHPGLADVFHPTQVWIFEKNAEGETIVERASDTVVVQQLAEQTDEVVPRWFSDHFEEKM